MSLEIWWIGKERKNKQIDEYLKRLGKYTKIQKRLIKDSKKNERRLKIQEESEQILSRIKPTDYLVLLDEFGKQYDSNQWAKHLNNEWLRHKKTIFLIGGAYGVGDEIKSRSNQTIALSKMTLPHEIARLLLIEQIYRSFTILNNENYHHS